MSKTQIANSDFMAPPGEQETNCRRCAISRVDAEFRAAGCIFSNLHPVTRSGSCSRVTGNSYPHWKKCKCYYRVQGANQNGCLEYRLFSSRLWRSATNHFRVAGERQRTPTPQPRM